MLLLGATIFFAAFVIITFSVTGSVPGSTKRVLQDMTVGHQSPTATSSDDITSTSATSTSPDISGKHDPEAVTKLSSSEGHFGSSSGSSSSSSSSSRQNTGGSLPVSPRSFHTVTTTQGFANHWQARIHYYWFLKQRRACFAQQPDIICDMGGFTRLLHSGEADDLLDEIPSIVVDHLPQSVLKSSSYVVLNRPYAFMEWLSKVSVPERYVLMAEADHLFLRPLPNLMAGEAGGAALFTYIVPEQYPDIVRKFTGPISDAEVR